MERNVLTALLCTEPRDQRTAKGKGSARCGRALKDCSQPIYRSRCPKQRANILHYPQQGLVYLSPLPSHCYLVSQPAPVLPQTVWWEPGDTGKAQKSPPAWWLQHIKQCPVIRLKHCVATGLGLCDGESRGEGPGPCGAHTSVPSTHQQLAQTT